MKRQVFKPGIVVTSTSVPCSLWPR